MNCYAGPRRSRLRQKQPPQLTKPVVNSPDRGHRASPRHVMSLFPKQHQRYSLFEPIRCRKENRLPEGKSVTTCRKLLVSLATVGLVTAGLTGGPVASAESAALYAKENLVAWCIVPFDAAQRGPEARAQMLKRLGLRKVAYDWRDEHVASFEAEILAYRKHGIEFFAFWGEHEAMFQLFEKYDIAPQVWKVMPQPQGQTQQAKVELAAKAMLPLVRRTRKLGCRLGLYNHGGWAGEPANMVAVCKWLRQHAMANHVGIVYNFHHGHQHVRDFSKHLQQMLPYLLCVNINGMNDNANPKILVLGQGKHEKKMLRIVQASGYRGPIGILDHQHEVDAEQSLRDNLDGLASLGPH